MATTVHPAPRAAADSYWASVRAPRYAVLLAFPLLGLYEILAALTVGTGAGAVRNGADVVIKMAFTAVAGAYGGLAFGVTLVAVGVWLVVRDIRANGRPVGRRFAFMLAEATVLSLLTGLVVGGLTSGLLRHASLLSAGRTAGIGPATQVVLSLGAGIYEELLFRVLLTGTLLAAGKALFGWRAGVAGTVAVLVSALIFAAFHYVGPYGDRLELASFTFRALAGVWFSALYVLRGFGITAWTHALYDVWVTVAM